MKSYSVPRLVRHFVRLFCVFSLGGCGPDKEFEAAPPFAEEDDVKLWATTASAVAVYTHAYELVGFADGEVTFPDSACPRTSDDGTTLTMMGSCTDHTDRAWKGLATLTRDGDALTVELDGWEDKNGTILVSHMEPTFREFDVDIVIGEVTTIAYSGTVAGDYDAPTTWNGSGSVTRRGPVAPSGTVEATTVDELVDDATCSGQPVSGTTTLQTRGDTAVVTYDGSSDCDVDGNARLVVNGDDRGLVSGILCSASATGARGAASVPPWVWLAPLAFALRWRRKPY